MKLSKIIYALAFVASITLQAHLISDDFPNTADNALEINFLSDINGTIETDTDEDWFKFTLDHDDGVIIKDVAVSNGNFLEVYTRSEALSSNPERIAILGFNYEDQSITLNLSAGTYYIKVYQYYGHYTNKNYAFTLRINGETAPAITLDAKTVQYCKDHPSACGITNDSLAYTQADINATIDSTKTLCKNNPSLCGIAPANILTLEDINTLSSGWHLVGTSEAINDFSLFSSVKVLWYWENGWKVYSPVEAIETSIQNSTSIRQLDTINAKKGFWILKN